jgi:type III secretion system YscD/HrpQ family protein
MKIEPHLEAMLPQLELRVLHGPQAGSRLTLAIGDYVLGTDDECEVMLAGPRMQGVHARLQFDGDLASITPLEGHVLDAQGKEISETFTLALGMPIELGGIWITVDEVDSPWPSTENLIPQPSPPPAPPTAEQTAARDAEHVSGIVQPAIEQDIQRLRARRILIAAMSTLAAIAVMGIAGAGWLASRSNPIETQPIAVTDDSKRIETLNVQLAEAFPGRKIAVSTGAGGVSVVTAYATDKGMADRMQIAIRKLLGTPVTHMYQDDLILQSARSIAQKFRQEGTRAMVKVNEANNGVIVVHGTVVSNTTREELLEAFRAGVPGLRNTEASLRNSEELPTLLAERMASAGLSKKLQVVSQQPEYTLRGSLSEEDMQRWEALLLEFNGEFGNLLPIRATITLLQRRPPVNIQTVVGGPMPFVITDTGQRISIGGEANGHTITAIRDNEVIFDGAQRFRIPR